MAYDTHKKILTTKISQYTVCCRDPVNEIPQVLDEELALDAAHVFSLIWSNKQMATRFKGMSHTEIDLAVDQAFGKLHDVNSMTDGCISTSEQAAIVISVLQQWLIYFLCKALMQLMTPEALVHHRKRIPSSYLENYLTHQKHFSLRGLTDYYRELLNQQERHTCLG